MKELVEVIGKGSGGTSWRSCRQREEERNIVELKVVLPIWEKWISDVSGRIPKSDPYRLNPLLLNGDNQVIADHAL